MQEKQSKTQYVLESNESVCLGLTNIYLWPICGDFLWFEHGQIFSPLRMGSFILSFIQVIVDSTFP